MPINRRQSIPDNLGHQLTRTTNWSVFSTSRAQCYCLSLILGFALWISGCKRQPEEIPSTPDGTVQAVIDGLADNQPEVFWDALPPSYQTDIHDLISVFYANADAELYDQLFRILKKGVRVMDEKEDYIFNSPMALGTPLIESTIGNYWSEIIKLLNTVVKSDISKLATLRQMDPGTFFSTTGHKFMERLETLTERTQRSERRNPWVLLKRAHIDFVESTDDQASLKFTLSTNVVEEIKMTRVEGKWVPADMAQSWKANVARAKEQMASMKSPGFQKARPMIKFALTTLEGGVNSLLNAESQQQFDETLKSLNSIGDMLRSLRGENRDEEEKPE